MRDRKSLAEKIIKEGKSRNPEEHYHTLKGQIKSLEEYKQKEMMRCALEILNEQRIGIWQTRRGENPILPYRPRNYQRYVRY